MQSRISCHNTVGETTSTAWKRLHGHVKPKGKLYIKTFVSMAICNLFLARVGWDALAMQTWTGVLLWKGAPGWGAPCQPSCGAQWRQTCRLGIGASISGGRGREREDFHRDSSDSDWQLWGQKWTSGRDLPKNYFGGANIFWQHHDLHLQRRISLNRVSKTSVPPLYFHLVKKKIAMSTFGETAGNRKGITLLLWFLTGQHMARKGMGWTTKG